MSRPLALIGALAMLTLAAPATADALYVVFENPADGALAVKGAATDPDMAKQGALQVDTIDLGIENSLMIDPKDDAIGPGRATFKPLGFSLPLGPGVPALLQTSGAGGHYKDATLHFRTDAGSEYATVALKIVTVTSVEIAASNGNAPQATVTLGYGSIKLDVSTLDAKGAASDPETGAWNAMTGTPDPSTVPKPQ